MDKDVISNYQGLDRKHVWHPFTQMKGWADEDFPVIESGEGCFLIDTEGRKYIDGVSSLWCNVHGHRHPKLNAALKNQIDKISHSTFLGLSNIPAVQLAEKLIQLTPENLTRVFYSDSGAEAVEVALKMGYQYFQQIGEKKRNKYIHLTDSYHGDTLGSVSVGGISLFHEMYKPFLFETIPVEAPHYYRNGNNRNEEKFLADFLSEMEEAIKKHNEELVGVVMEPLVLGAAGILKQPACYLKGVRELTKKYGILLIVDEVATGFGRTGKMFACDHEDVAPDLMALGKGITGGYLPLSVTLATEEIYKAFLGEYHEFKTFFHGHTYTGNPLAAAVSLANLEVFEEEKTLDNLQLKIEFLKEKLESFHSLQFVGDVRQMGFMVGIEIVKNKETKEEWPSVDRIGHEVTLKAREKGVIIRPLGNVVVLMPPLSIEIETLEKLIDVTRESIKEVTEVE